YDAKREIFYRKNIRTGKDIVVKRYLFDQFDIERYKTTVLTTLVSQFFANQFNNTKVASRKISFKNVYLLNYNNHLYFLESELNNFTKFNNNAKYYNYDEKYKTLEAFMHFTYNYSNNQLVICDLQGDIYNYDYELTDATINSINNFFGITDQGINGITKVLGSYKYNSFCLKLNL
ncbi:833_t:CDS:1, partial [Scutellospora calospora]